MQAGFEGLYNALPNDLPDDGDYKSDEEYETITIPRPGGGEMNLYVFRSGKEGAPSHPIEVFAEAVAVGSRHGGKGALLSRRADRDVFLSL